jgi:PAS domain S-box-containing protein
LLLMLTRDSSRAHRMAREMTGDLEKLGLAARVNKIGIWDYDPVCKTVEWDDAMFSLYGRDPRDYDRAIDAWNESLHPDDRNIVEQAIRDALNGIRNFDSEFRVINPDGSIRHISAKAKVFQDSSGNPVRMLGTSTDITDRQRTAIELDETRSLQDAIQDAAGVSIIATDPEGTIIMYNKAAERMLGYRRESVVGKMSTGCFHDPQEVAARAQELTVQLGRNVQPGFDVVKAMLADGKSDQREWTYVRKDGTTFPVLLTVTSFRDKDDHIAGYLGIAADVSERKLVLQKLEDANAQLARSNKDLEQFAYAASHDLQEPLRKVTAFCELLGQECSDQISADGKQYMEFIIDGGRRMRSLIQDLLAYSRIEFDGAFPSNVDLNEIVKFAMDSLSEVIFESGGIVTFDDLPNVKADSSRLLALFQNLISNSIKYHGDDPPRIHIRCRSYDSYNEFSIVDNGIGIEPAYRDQIFGVFKRLHSKAEYPGTGIGLAICKRIIDQLGGRIWVESSPGGGATFRFQIPTDSQPMPTALASGTLSLQEGSTLPVVGPMHGTSGV